MDGLQINQVRIALGLSQREFAKQLNISERTVSRWETHPEEEVLSIVETAIRLYLEVIDLRHKLKK